MQFILDYISQNFLNFIIISLLILLVIIKIFSFLYNQYFSEYNFSFLIKEGDFILLKKGKCDIRYNPCSTFKIAISLMALKENLIKNKYIPLVQFSLYYPETKNNCKKAQTPISWIKNDCTWYSLAILESFNQDNIVKFKYYLDQFQYGNQDISYLMQNYSAFSNLWHFGSLKISIKEQIIFLQQLLDNKFELSNEQFRTIKEILFINKISNQWNLYGKTGMGQQSSNRNSKKLLYQIWFIGWIEKNDRKIIFASHIAYEHNMHNSELDKYLQHKINKILINIINKKIIK